MNIRVINPDTLARPGGHYSHAVVAHGMVYVAGQLPIEPSGHKLVDSSFEAQAAQTLRNVEAAIVAAGSSKNQLVHVRVYIADIDFWPAFNAIYASWVGEHRPARAVVPVPGLHHGFLLEIEAIAAL
jgi:2-iminobutanoate/2-iminopropanoate deaminase